MPPKIFSSVVLPAPEGPTMTQISPFSMIKLASCSACTDTSPVPYRFSTFSKEIKELIQKSHLGNNKLI